MSGQPRRAAWKAKRSPQRNSKGRNSYYEHRHLQPVREPRPDPVRGMAEPPILIEHHVPTEVEGYLALLDYQDELYGVEEESA